MKALSRNQIYLAGLVLIVIFTLVNRLNEVLFCEFSTAKVVDIEPAGDRGEFSKLTLLFTRNDNVLQEATSISKRQNFRLGNTVEVFYKKAKPHTVRIYSFREFYMPTFIWMLMPIIIFSAAVYSYLSPKARFELGKGGKMKLYVSKNAPKQLG